MTTTEEPADESSPARTELDDRRQFLTKALAAAGGTAAFMAGFPGTAAGIPRQDVARILDPTVGVEGNPLERMLEDLQRALAKPLNQRKWVMVIDLQRCIGCKACTVSCAAENNLPPGVVYRPVVEEEIGVFPNVRKRFTPRPCMQCDNPPCVPVCPVDATYSRPDGIVAVDYVAEGVVRYGNQVRVKSNRFTAPSLIAPTAIAS